MEDSVELVCLRFKCSLPLGKISDHDPARGFRAEFIGFQDQRTSRWIAGHELSRLVERFLLAVRPAEVYVGSAPEESETDDEWVFLESVHDVLQFMDRRLKRSDDG
jgi:hypothetical protein